MSDELKLTLEAVRQISDKVHERIQALEAYVEVLEKSMASFTAGYMETVAVVGALVQVICADDEIAKKFNEHLSTNRKGMLKAMEAAGEQVKYESDHFTAIEDPLEGSKVSGN